MAVPFTPSVIYLLAFITLHNTVIASSTQINRGYVYLCITSAISAVNMDENIDKNRKYLPGSFVTYHFGKDSQHTIVERVINRLGFNEYQLFLLYDGKRIPSTSLNIEPCQALDEEFDEVPEINVVDDNDDKSLGGDTVPKP